jgi:hypothetical protein
MRVDDRNVNGEGYSVIESKEDLEEIKNILVEVCHTFTEFEDLKMLKELFIEVCREHGEENSNKNLSSDK